VPYSSAVKVRVLRKGKYKKERGLLKPITLAGAKQYERFVSEIPEGSIVEFFYELQHDDGTLPQLAKLHAMIKQLATHIGETAENMKLLIKDRAGLCIAREVSGREYFLAKSFGDCSKEELSLAIQAAIEIGEEVNFLLG
jgi:hypothetical protein